MVKFNTSGPQGGGGGAAAASPPPGPPRDAFAHGGDDSTSATPEDRARAALARALAQDEAELLGPAPASPGYVELPVHSGHWGGGEAGPAAGLATPSRAPYSDDPEESADAVALGRTFRVESSRAELAARTRSKGFSVASRTGLLVLAAFVVLVWFGVGEAVASGRDRTGAVGGSPPASEPLRPTQAPTAHHPTTWAPVRAPEPTAPAVTKQRFGDSVDCDLPGTDCIGGRPYTIDLMNSGMVGTLPEALLLKVKDTLEVLMLSGNDITGTLPSALGKLEKLRLFDASRNSLSGDLPADLLDLPKVREVNLSENAGLGGTVVVPKIPSPLRVLDLRGTAVRGCDDLRDRPDVFKNLRMIKCPGDDM